jgi:hypothetical protein
VCWAAAGAGVWLYYLTLMVCVDTPQERVSGRSDLNQRLELLNTPRERVCGCIVR